MATTQNNIVLPAEFSGNAQLLLYTRYDDPRAAGWESKWIINWKVQQLHPWFPVSELKIHKHFWPLLQDAFFALETSGLYKEIKSFHRCYEVAHLPGSPVLSVHSWGAAIDLNPEDNPMGSMGTWSDEFIETMLKNGIYSGQHWTGNREPMHFAMVDG
jgi:hypothetical protein